MPAPSSFFIPESLVVPPDVARSLLALLRPGLAQARAEGLLVHNERLTAWLRDLERMAAAARPTPSTAAPVPVVERWLTTSEAARRLGLSDRRVRDLKVTKRRNGRDLVLLEADVEALAAERAAVCGSHRKPRNGPASIVDT
jgi:hypothetical protein